MAECHDLHPSQAEILLYIVIHYCCCCIYTFSYTNTLSLQWKSFTQGEIIFCLKNFDLKKYVGNTWSGDFYRNLKKNRVLNLKILWKCKKWNFSSNSKKNLLTLNEFYEKILNFSLPWRIFNTFYKKNTKKKLVKYVVHYDFLLFA